jgi:hypothetical protein
MAISLLGQRDPALTGDMASGLTRLKEYSHTKHGLLTIEESAEIATRIIGKS